MYEASEARSSYPQPQSLMATLLNLARAFARSDILFPVNNC